LCERIAAPEALSLGLVDYISDKGQALVRAQALAAQTLAQPAATVRMSKESVNAAATALNNATSYMAHDQIALAASSPESRVARGQALG
jgi:enoyl-CoA hydratase/carnithine racemase